MNVQIIYEDIDDDSDTVLDSSDSCYRGELNWTSKATTDNDSEGCQDSNTELNED